MPRGQGLNACHLMKHSLLRLLGLWIALHLPSSLSASDWPAWRGPEATGSIQKGHFPTQWGKEDLAWKLELPGKGCSTPIHWNGILYVTAPVEGRDALLAIDHHGKILWQAIFGEESAGKHRNGSGSNPSPVTDGERVYVSFKSGTLAAVDLQGRILWQDNLVQKYGPDTLYWDHGSSPVLTRKHVVMVRMHEGESWLAAFDKATGNLDWKIARNFVTPREGDHGYTTPLVLEENGRETVLVWGGMHLTSHDALDGSVLWTCGDFNPEGRALWPAVSTPVVCEGMAVVPYGRNDRKVPRLHGIRLDGKGGKAIPRREWVREDISSFVPSPASWQGRVYLLRDRGEVECLNPQTGASFWQGRLPEDRSNYYSSPLIAGGHLYAAREDGVVFVADVRGGFQLVSENPMGEPIIAAPVPFRNLLILRGTQNLFAIQGGRTLD